MSFGFLKYLPYAILVLLLSGCGQGNSPGKNGLRTQRVIVHPYGHDLFTLDPMNLEKPLSDMLVKYRFFLGDELDQEKIRQLRDFILNPLNQELAESCELTYADPAFLENGLAQLFSRCQTEIPGFTDPQVFTYISGLLYEMPVQYLDSVMIIGIDMFLGRNYGPYRAIGLPMYLTRRMERENILPECARQIAFSLMPEGAVPHNLLDHMILGGKVLYAMDILLPDTPDSLKIGYTAGQMEWCNRNEKNLWRMLIDQDLLYSSDPMVIRKFIRDGPFTAGMPDGSPARLGEWNGWEIVRSYMERNDRMTLIELFNNADSQVILSRSGYKPKK